MSANAVIIIQMIKTQKKPLIKWALIERYNLVK